MIEKTSYDTNPSTKTITIKYCDGSTEDIKCENSDDMTNKIIKLNKELFDIRTKNMTFKKDATK